MIHRALAALALAGFLLQTGVVLLRFGYLGFFETATSNGVVLQFFFDLVICLSFIAVWMVYDAGKLSISPWPFVGLGAAFGVAGPLAYVLRRPRSRASEGERRLPVPALVAGGVVVPFLVFSLVVLGRYGYVSFVLFAGANEATQLLFLDLALSTLFLSVLVVRDARDRGASYGPFLIIAFFFGGIGPLLYLSSRGLPRWPQRLAGIAGIAAVAFAMTLGSGQADLRNQRVRNAGPEAERLGRERLQRLAERHGLEAWRGHVTMETVAEDRWPGLSWWPAGDQRFRAQALLGSFTSRAELLDGPMKGEVWGLQSWAPYKNKKLGAEPEFLSEPDAALTFYLPTLQYFNELPFRLLQATVVRDAGSARHRGRDYDLLFVTWLSPEVHPDLDHYLLWIDRETGLLTKARYTVRDAVPRLPELQRKIALPLIAGTIHFEDYREVDGVQVPFTQTITLPPPELTRYPLSRYFFHRLEVEKAAFDTVSRETLVPDPSRGEPGDRKPTASPSESDG